MKIRQIIIAVFILTLSFNIFAETTQQQNVDALEKYNRVAFKFNNHFDKWVATPVAKAYLKVFPQPVRTGISNVFDNITEMPSTANSFLQGNFYEALNNGWRFIINSTVGLGGIFDVASHIGLTAYYTDFGLTMAKWGWTNSCYFVIPILGPSTVRDAIGKPVDHYLFSPYIWINPAYIRWIISGAYGVVLRAKYLSYESVFSTAMFDPYIFQRNAFLQNRNYRIEQTIQGIDWRQQASDFNKSVPKSFFQLNPYAA